MSRIFHRHHLVLLLLAAAATNMASAQTVPGPWQLTWADEFNGGSVDLAPWQFETGGGGWGNNEKQVYTTSAQNVSVSGGALQINAIATGTGANQSYTSARMKTDGSFAQAYGLFEFRAKLPAGTGLWPALWLLPEDKTTYGGWPISGEIDVLESKGQDNTLVQGSLHTGPSGNLLNTQTAKFADSGLEPDDFTTTDWHVYDLLWSPGTPGHAGSIKWYVDGTLYQSHTGGWTRPDNADPNNKDAPFDQPFYMIMNLAVGGTYGGTPALAPGAYNMQVDYVRAYATLPEPGCGAFASLMLLALCNRSTRRKRS
jgi:beta-glucanase (GH16 family)